MTDLAILGQAAESSQVSEVAAEPAGEQGQAVITVDANAPAKTTPGRPVPGYYQWIFIVAIFLMMYLILFREPRKRQRQHQQMVQTLKKNDKVRTLGGIIGTVVDIKGDEVILKVDESNNTKIRVVSSAIGKNLSGEGQ